MSSSVLRYERLRDDAMADARRYPESATGFVAAARVWNHRAIDERTGRLCITPIANGHCPDCGDYAPSCVCAEIDEGRATELLTDYPCYACGAESTHEIMHRGAPLDVCDACDERRS